MGTTGVAAATRRRRRLATVAVFVGMWCFGLLILAAVIMLREREDKVEHAPAVVAGLRAQVGQIPGLTFDAAPGHGKTPLEVRTRLGEEQATFQESLAKLESVRPNATDELDTLGKHFFDTAWQMLSLIA